MLEVVSTDPGAGTLRAKCLNTTTLGERKNCNLPGVKVGGLLRKALHGIRTSSSSSARLYENKHTSSSESHPPPPLAHGLYEYTTCA
jgi:hypothetical protein